ncbi:cation:proton antiporter subunit C [Haloglomus litoreum]|uniref:cation:proton antiporter subunit C n=1 Tax=Haloglomus litoreum TaxID=3034026 RepID=UPI0023E87284|nr:cation:proton antiporter subunit C [Haloglomus sp. DT116]
MSVAAYVVAVLLAGIGLFVLVDDRSLVKKVLGLNVFQTGIFLFFIAGGDRTGGAAPLLTNDPPYVDPVPAVLILTAVVVGVSVTGVALALLVRIYDEYGTLDAAVLGTRRDDEVGDR